MQAHSIMQQLPIIMWTLKSKLTANLAKKVKLFLKKPTEKKYDQNYLWQPASRYRFNNNTC